MNEFLHNYGVKVYDDIQEEIIEESDNELLGGNNELFSNDDELSGNDNELSGNDYKMKIFREEFERPIPITSNTKFT
ncbi:12636_t:CDS:2 [Acaulospora colombiana]|uniref:12636_t:CDS:1 n=1 Tax=Acaulospora colombiana TaxID=27376 RepID=A0ACA9KLV1_9GLOM|nr:12636_t:CDS:2 [Acaulospora colombiana]